MAILVDTSVWVDHFRKGNRRFSEMLENGRVLCHPHIIGELACGNLQNRGEILEYLTALPQADCASVDEGLAFLESETLYGRGLGWIDVQLLAAARLTPCQLWTLDRRFADVAGELGVGAG